MSRGNLQIETKTIILKGLPIAYYTLGEGKPVVFLHGWGASASSFNQVQLHLGEGFATYSLDMPGFGNTPPPEAPWSVYDYAELVEEFLLSLKIEKPIIIGHSFGGRLGIILGAKNIPHKMILVDSAGIKSARSWRYYLKVYSYKGAKKLFALPGLKALGKKVLALWENKAGSDDYRQAKGAMRQTFVKVVNEDLTYLLTQVAPSTLLVWGELDQATPLSDGKLMEKLIPGSGLVVFNGAGHYSFLECLPQFLRVIDSFLAQDKIKGE